jgi:replication factor A1
MSTPSNADEPVEVRLRDLRAGSSPVHVLGRVVSVTKKEVTRKSDGRRLTVMSGFLSDGTATVRFTWWEPPAEGVDRGTVLRAVNAQVREFRHRPELSFGWSTRIQPASELELPRVEAADLPLRGVAELEPGSEGFRLEVRVVDVVDRIVTVGEERRTLHSGHLTDRTGVIPFTAWVDFRLRPGATVRIVGAYVRAFRGRPEATLDERSHTETIPEDQVPVAPVAPLLRRSLGAVEASGGRGMPEVSVEGLVVALLSPSGVVSRCPTCHRVLQDGRCGTHGQVEGVADLRARVVLDDGTGVATVNLGGPLTEKLMGRSLKEHLDRPGAAPGAPSIEEEIRDRLVGSRLRVGGHARVDEFGTSIFATDCEAADAAPSPAVELLAQRLAEQPR